MRLLNLSNKIIEYSFYALFFLVPLAFWKDTSELYELNKMWITFILVLLIAAAWGVKTVVLKKFYLQRTPLDIPIAVFLISQVISTIFSLDSYVSLWGYYSRFNGGLIASICYIFLYYAFLSNFELKTKALDVVKKILGVSLISSAIVVLWGLPSHFGYDPTCFLFRGSLDVSCWTADFQPKIRIFSTLGQPDWLGAYLVILIPLALAFFLNSKRKLQVLGFAVLSVLLYLALLFTKSRSALLGFWISASLFGAHYIIRELEIKIKNFNFKKNWPKITPISVILIVFILLTAYIYNPIELYKGKFVQKTSTETSGTFSTGGGGTESGKIRLYVWQGALTAWINNPIIGTGVETFAFAYYKYKPVAHNSTSEWNYLYNKAHNEYLNFLATSGILGLGSYLSIIAVFFYSIRKKLNRRIDILILALVTGYIGILVTNFFGFSVVIVNIYFFLIPAFVFVLLGMVNQKNVFVRRFGKEEVSSLSLVQKFDILVIFFMFLYLFLFLVNFWLADQAFALGGNLTNTGQYSDSYYKLKEAVDRIGFEPTYKNELASNDAIFAVSLLSQVSSDTKDKDKIVSFAQELAKESKFYAEQNTSEHPNDVTFWKTKVRVYYLLSQIDPKYTKDALSALEKASTLAPADPNIFYNLGLLYGQNGDTKKGTESLNKAIKIKPNYESAYYALGLFYRELATDKNGRVIDEEMNKKAIEQMEYILKHINPKSKEAQDALDSFQK